MAIAAPGYSGPWLQWPLANAIPDRNAVVSVVSVVTSLKPKLTNPPGFSGTVPVWDTLSRNPERCLRDAKMSWFSFGSPGWDRTHSKYAFLLLAVSGIWYVCTTWDWHWSSVVESIWTFQISADWTWRNIESSSVCTGASWCRRAYWACFYRAMHFSAKCSIAIACRLSVWMSV